MNKHIKRLLILCASLGINSNAFRSAGFIVTRTKAEYTVVKMLNEAISIWNSRAKIFLPVLSQIPPAEDFLGAKEFENTTEEFENATKLYNGGMLLDFACGDDFVVGTHIFMTTTPGIDVYMAYKIYSNIQIGIGFGAGFVTNAIKLKESDTPITLPWIEGFTLIKGDYFINLNDAEPNDSIVVSIGYKRSTYPTLGSAQSIFLAISRTF